MKQLIFILLLILLPIIGVGQTIDLDKQAPPGDSTWTSIDADTLYLAKDSIYITASGDSLKFVSDTAYFNGIVVVDKLEIKDLASPNTVVLTPTSTGKVDTTETVLGTAITWSSLTADAIDVTNDIDVGDTLEFDNGAKIHNESADTLYLTETVTKIEGNLHVTGTVMGESAYANMYWNNNGNATVIETASTPIMLRQLTEGINNGFTFNAGSTGGITAYSDGTGKVNVASNTHGLETGDDISIRGTTNYNGIWEITKIDANNFSIPDTWAVDDGASDWDEGAHYVVTTAGNYDISWHGSLTPQAGVTLKSQACVNSTLCTKCIGERKFANNDIGNLIGGSYATLAAGDKVYLVITSSATSDITIKYGNFKIKAL